MRKATKGPKAGGREAWWGGGVQPKKKKRKTGHLHLHQKGKERKEGRRKSDPDREKKDRWETSLPGKKKRKKDRGAQGEDWKDDGSKKTDWTKD